MHDAPRVVQRVSATRQAVITETLIHASFLHLHLRQSFGSAARGQANVVLIYSQITARDRWTESRATEGTGSVVWLLAEWFLNLSQRCGSVEKRFAYRQVKSGF